MRGLKQTFPCLYLFGNNKFIDGKKVEMAHLWGKMWQVKHNNFRLPFKTMVTKHASRMLSLIYIFNGGKWGDELQYCIGPQIQNLTNVQRSKPHALLEKLVIPKPLPTTPKIEIKRLYKASYLKDNDIVKIFFDKTQNELNQLLNMQFDDNITCEIEHILDSPAWSVRQIASFIFHQGTSSFHMNFDKLCNGVKNRCLVKLKQGYIMKFTQAFAMEYQDTEVALLCKGILYPIHVATNPDQWLDDYFSSMDYINVKNAQVGWSFMTNIDEPIFLLHNCVSFQQIKQQLPDTFKDINKYDFVQNLISWSNQMHRWKNSHLPQSYQVQLPCGTHYVCKQHGTNACTQCVKRHNVYPTTHWKLKWQCNKQQSPHFYIFDKRNGLVMTMMKTAKKYTE